MIRAILRWPHPVLRRPAAPVVAVDDAVRAHWQDMVDTMEAMPGLGLAAPQIGVGLRLAVVDASDARGQVVRMANPAVIHASGEMREHVEASPCLPGVSAPVRRPRAVTVRFLNDRGQAEERDFVLVWATSVQHQIDHLEGRLFVDRLGPVRRRMLLARAEKLARGGAGR